MTDTKHSFVGVVVYFLSRYRESPSTGGDEIQIVAIIIPF